MLRGVQHGGGINDLAAHVRCGRVDDGQTGRVSVGTVDDAAVNGALRDLGGDFLDVAAVGDMTGSGQGSLIQLIVGENLLCVLADGNVLVAHG